MLTQTPSALSPPRTQNMSLRSVGTMTQYEERVREVEHATFGPGLVLSATGGQGKAATPFYKRLGLMIGEKRNEPYSITMVRIGCRLGFVILRSATMSLQGHQSWSRVGVAQPSSTAECNLVL